MCRYKEGVGWCHSAVIDTVTGSKFVRVCIIRKKYTHGEYFMRRFYFYFFYFACDVEDH